MQVSIYFTHHTLGHSYFTKENFLKYFPFHSTFLAQSPCNNLPWKGIGCAWSRAQKGSVSFFGRRNWFIWCEWKWIEWLLPPLRQIFVLNPAWLLPHTHPSSLLLSKGWDLQGITEIPSRKTPISFFPLPKKSCQGGGAQEQDTAPNQHHGVPPSLHPLWKNMIPAPSDGKAKETPCYCWLSQGEPALPSIPTQEFSFPQRDAERAQLPPWLWEWVQLKAFGTLLVQNSIQSLSMVFVQLPVLTFPWARQFLGSELLWKPCKMSCCSAFEREPGNPTESWNRLVGGTSKPILTKTPPVLSSECRIFTSMFPNCISRTSTADFSLPFQGELPVSRQFLSSIWGPV